MVYFFSASTGNGFTYRGNETAICGCEMVAVFTSFNIRNKILKYKIDEINNVTVASSLDYNIQVLLNGMNDIPQLHGVYHS